MHWEQAALLIGTLLALARIILVWIADDRQHRLRVREVRLHHQRIASLVERMADDSHPLVCSGRALEPEPRTVRR